MKRLGSTAKCLALAATLAAGHCLIPEGLVAQMSPTAPEPPTNLESLLGSPNPFEQREFMSLHHQLRILGFLSVLGLIPFVVVMMTSFTRITIIFHFLRQALATQQVPSNHIVIGLSLILTGFVMHPVITEIHENALAPYFNNEFKNAPEVLSGAKGEDFLLLERVWDPMRTFMLHHTREKDLLLFMGIGNVTLPRIDGPGVASADADETGSAYDLKAIPWYCLVPSFVLSELRMAFMMGFLLFMPFLVIDMIVASILMSMGMMMLPPMMISMPFKILLFIIVDGWRLVIQQTVNGFFPLG